MRAMNASSNSLQAWRRGRDVHIDRKNDERAGVCVRVYRRQKNVTSETDNGGVVYRLECCAGGPGRCMAAVAPYSGGVV